MLVPWSWLTQWVHVVLTPNEVGERLAFTGLEVEAIAGRGWPNVVIGEIQAVEPHPNADRLVVCRVATGEAEPRQIVCGATNMAEGDRVPVALPGAQLGELKIKKSKLRGVVSEGMMCSPRELGLGDDHAGLLILDRDTPVGAPATEVIGGAGPVLEVSITPNRGDCLSIRGLAREVALIADCPVTPPTVTLEEAATPVANATSVTLEDAEGCPRYTCRVMEGVTVRPSPAWLAEALRAAGLRPINNVVDAANYVMLEFGQPLHAFDLDTLAEQRIVVRRGRPNETIVTLEGAECAVTGEMTVIADAKKPVALAGIMGGADSAVSDTTTRLLLESAYFDPARTRRTARTLGLATEACYRFERGVDIAAVPEALDRLAQLIADTAGGAPLAGRIDAYPVPFTPPTIPLRIPRIERILGVAVEATTARAQLQSLGCTVKGKGKTLSVTVPSWRSDLTREIDLIEEVARLTGYDNIPATLPAGRGKVEAVPDAESPVADRVRDVLTGAGLSEVCPYWFGQADDAARLGFDPAMAATESITILNPLSEDRAVMRTHLFASLLKTGGANQRKGNADLALFEVGQVFRAGADGLAEPTLVGGLFAGRRRRGGWSEPDRAADVYDAKGALEGVLDALRAGAVAWHEGDRPYFQPGTQAAARLGDTVIGWVGEFTPQVLEAFGAQGPMFGFVLNLDLVASHTRDVVRYSPFSRFPPVLRVRTYDVPEAVLAADLTATVAEAGGELLEAAELTDVYRGEKVEPRKKSLTFALVFRAPDRTLTDAEVETALQRLDHAVRTRQHATVREA